MSGKDFSTLTEEFSEKELQDNTFSVVFLESGEVSSMEASVLIENPFEFDVSRLVPSMRLMNLDRFFEIAAELIEDAQDREGVVASQRVPFVIDFNPEDFDQFPNEVITYTVKRRYPANMNPGADSRPQYGATHLYKRKIPEAPNKVILVENVPIDHDISITCWASTATLAEKRANWIEKLFKVHRWAFTQQGVDRLRWNGRSSNTLWTPRSQRIHQRSHDFFVRLQEFEIRESPVIAEMMTKFQLY